VFTFPYCTQPGVRYSRESDWSNKPELGYPVGSIGGEHVPSGFTKILLAVFLIPAAAIVYILTFFFLEEANYRRGASACVAAGIVTWMFIACYWVALWSGSVQWTRRRFAGTLVAALCAVGGAILLGIAAEIVVRGSRGTFGAFCGSMFAPIAWLIATVFIWRETAAERRARVSSSSTTAVTCPTCGYNLTGLTATRCPECGKQCTLDELFAAQSTERDVDG